MCLQLFLHYYVGVTLLHEALLWCCGDVCGLWFSNRSCVCHTRRTTPEKFYIEACDDGSEDVLAIDRVSTEITLTGKHRLGD